MNIEDEKTLIVKVVLVGESEVGKSSLFEMFCFGKEKLDHVATIGVDFAYKILDLDGKALKLQVWDTAGLEKFKPIATLYYKGANAAVLVYSVNNRDSFTTIETLAKEISDFGVQVVFLVGNKADVSDRVVETSEGQQFADDHNMKFFEVSAFDSSSVENIFLELCQHTAKTEINNERED